MHDFSRLTLNITKSDMQKTSALILAFAMCLTLSMPVLAAKKASIENEANSEEAKGIHPWNDAKNTNVVSEFSHWSLLLEAGFNAYDGDFNTEMKHPVGFPSAGVSLEYTFTPFIGLGVNYMFSKYHVTGIENYSADPLLDGMMHKTGVYLPVDLVSCFFPRAKHKLFSVQLIAGGGLAWYTNTVFYTQEDRGNTLNVVPNSLNGEYKFFPYVNVGANIEFNLGRSIGLGVKGMYNYFTRDDVDGRFGGASVNNDGIVDVTISLRYKINAHKKSHERNVGSHDYVMQLVNKGEDAALGKAITAEDVAREIIEKGLLKSAKDTMLLVRKDTVVQASNLFISNETSGNTNEYYVYFGSGKSSLGDQGLIAIQQAASRMQKDESLYAVVVGRCDNTGSDKTNFLLSQKRARRVEQELVAEHGIDPDRLLAYGAGRIIGKRSKAAYTPNRRAEIILLTEEEFNQQKQEIREQQENKAHDLLGARGVGMKTTNEEEIDLQEDIENFSEESPDILDTVIVTKGTTLANLARKYYNMHFELWKYIYEANRDMLTNPNILKEGITLVIPALSEEQKKAINEESSIY